MSFKNVIYRNLAAEMARRGMRRKDIASILNISASSACYKLAGKSALTITEAFKIRDELFPTLMVDYLFDTRPRYDSIDIFNFPRTQTKVRVTNNSGNEPDDCA